MTETSLPQQDKEHLTRELDTISGIVEQGVTFLRESKFREAQSFFCDRRNAEKARVTIADAGLLISSEALESEEALIRASAEIAARFWQKFQTRTLEIGGVDVIPPVPEGTPALERLRREVALLCTEEWVHLLQDTQEEQSGFPLVSEKLRKKKNPDLTEVDIAIFLNEHGVPLKDTFWAQRAGRNKHIKF